MDKTCSGGKAATGPTPGLTRRIAGFQVCCALFLHPYISSLTQLIHFAKPSVVTHIPAAKLITLWSRGQVTSLSEIMT